MTTKGRNTTNSNNNNEETPSSFGNNTNVEQLMEAARQVLGTEVDVQTCTRILRHNWIENMRDVRLIHKEGNLIELRTIATGVLQWLMEECNKRFDDEEISGSASGDLKRFVYVSDFDPNGIIYYLATHGGTRDWTNPAVSGDIRVTASTLMHDSTPASAAVGRETVRCVTKPEKNSWFLFDFAPRKIRPTHYTVRHYSTWDTEALRSWEFEGSNDGQTFFCIRSHVNDTGLIGKGGTHTWKVDCGERYSMFRIRQTDFNSNRHYYLAVSGFEIYGDMQEAQVVVSNKSSLTFIPSYDFDTNGICYWLGTNKGVEPWQNPALRGFIRILYSTLAADSKPAYFVVGRETVRCVTEPKKMSWFVIDFKNIKIIPTHYSLKHYITFDTECLRNWRFEASDDSSDGVNGQWVTLITHNNDTALNRKGATHTWQIPSQVVKNQPFSKFRLFQFGPNSNSHHYLPCSGFEIYGTVVSGMEVSSEEEAPSGASRVFKYTHDMDYNGLFYFLGTNGGERQWTNPVDSRLVVVEASSLMSDSVPLSALCGRSSVRCVTKPHQKSWMSVNLKDIKIKLSHYTLRHYNSWDTEALRFWVLEGSNDGVAWIPLRQHNDDRALRKAGMAHTWTVETSQYFSRFRIFMTGRNSNNHWYLACSGMELYGDAVGGLVSQKASAPPPIAPIPPPVPKPDEEKIDTENTNSNPSVLPDDEVGGGPLPLVPSKSQQLGPELSGEAFSYSSDLDTHGICYWLGTNCGTEAWQNPMKRGFIVVRSNGLMNDSVPMEAIVGREVVRCVTKPVKQAWFEIDFQNYAILPTHYTLRHYSSWDTEALRNWRLEASCDGERWTVLREHKNDTALNFKGQTYTWTLTTVGYFSRFRIFQFDKNSNSHYYLSLSGFEIYGHVVRQHSTLSWDQWPKSKSKSLNVDATRNVVQNSGSNDQWQTCKAREPLIFGVDGLAEFSLLIERMENTTNSWKFMAGIAPESFTCQNNKQWLGAQKSWGYIAGTGGKCFDVGKSLPYGQKWGSRAGDCVTVVADAKNKTIEFILNGVSQGMAFDNFDTRAGSMFAAVSLTATNSSIRLMNRVSPSSGPPQSVQRIVGVPYTSPVLSARNPLGSVSTPVNFGWDATLKSPNLAIFPDGVSVTNKGSNDTWQGVVSQAVFQNGKHSFEIHVINDTKTTNTWKFIVGVAPVKYDPRKTAWLGSQNSWGYIGGTGGKCHQVGKTINYGATYGSNDVVKCQVNFDDSTIEFFVNGKSQGIAFDNLTGPVKPAISLCGKGSCLRIANVL